MGKGGGGTNTTVQSNSPPPDVMAQYDKVIAQANQVASTPYTTGGFNASNLVAGFNPTQQQAFNTVNGAQGAAQPYLNSAQTDINNSTSPIWSGVQQFSPDTVQQYMSPYTSDVVNATGAQLNNQDAQQQQQVIGNAVSAGAWGGDRSAIAQSELANQQSLANNQTIAGLENQGYTQGLNEFNTQQQAQIGANEANSWLNSQAGFAEGNLGNEALTTALTGATAQLNIGNQQQTLAQQQLNVPYEQFLAQQAYPYQQTGWLSGISTGIGGSSGGTGTTTSPAPNSFSQDVGTAAGLGTLGYLGYLALSDRRMKENIKRIGTMDGKNGKYSIYSYNYKGDHEPRMGVIAQEVEKTNPHAVHEADGLKYVNYSKLARGGMVPNLATGGTPYSGLSPFASDAMSMPDVSVSYVPGAPSIHGSMGPPHAPNPSNGQSGGMSPQSGIGNLSSVLKMGKSNIGGESLASQAGTGFDVANAQNAGFGNEVEGFMNPNGTTNISNLTNAAGDSVGAGATDMAATGMDGFLSSLGIALKRGGAAGHYDDGGVIGGLTPSAAGSNPFTQNQYAQYQSLPVEKLQELAARLGNSPQGQIVRKALQQKQTMSASGSTTQPQAGLSPQGFDDGGNVQDPYTKDLSDMFDAKPDTAGPTAATPDQGSQGLNPASTRPDFTNAQPINKPDPILGLLSTMAAIGAGKSSKFGVNAGQGALQGLNEWQQQKQEAAKESENQGSLQAKAEELFDTAKYHQDQIKHEGEQLTETSTHNRAEEAIQQAQLKKAQMALEQGKIATNPITGQLYYTVGPKAGQIVPNQEQGSQASTYAQNIGVPLVPYTGREDAKNSADMIRDAGKNTAQVDNSIESVKRVKELLPKIDQGKLSQAFREGEQVLGVNSPERAAYNELQKLEGNAAINNEVSQGVSTRYLGFNMVKLGQNLFASPEMDKTAQGNILDKSLKYLQMEKNANEAIQPFEGHSTGTLNRVKQDYYNKSLKAGQPIETTDYLSGKASVPAAPEVLAAPPPMETRVEGQTYQTPKGPMTWTKAGWLPPSGG